MIQSVSFLLLQHSRLLPRHICFLVSESPKKNAEGIKFLGAALYADNRPLIEVGLQPYQFHNFIMTFVGHS